MSVLKHGAAVSAIVVLCGWSAAQTTLWTYTTEVMPLSPTLYPNAERPEGAVVVAGAKIMLLDGAGKALWTADLPAAAAQPPTVADLNGDKKPEIIVPLANGLMACLDAKGQSRWKESLERIGAALGLITAADVHCAPGVELIVPRSDGWLFCMGALGNELWRFHGDRFRAGPAAVGDVDNDGQPEIVYGTDNGNVYCLSGEGRVKWRYTDDNPVNQLGPNLAPFGRSGPNLARLAGDTRASVLITRSNAGRYMFLLAIDGVTGTTKWRTEDFMQSTMTNAVADLDGDGALEVLHGDKGNYLYCSDARGKERWRAALAGRGIFWAPAIADLDGDGAPDIVAQVRDNDPAIKASQFVVSADGKTVKPLTLGGNGNAAPAVGDLNGDGNNELLLVTGNPNAVHCLSWGQGGKVLWPSLRGDSAMTARANVPMGIPVHAADLSDSGLALKIAEKVFVGDNRGEVSWPQAAPENACLEVTVLGMRNRRSITVLPVDAGKTSLAFDYSVPRSEPCRLEVRLLQSGKTQALAGTQTSLTVLPADTCDMEAVNAACDKAMESLKNETVIRALSARKDALIRAQARLTVADAQDAGFAARATALREETGRLAGMAAFLQERATQGNDNPVLWWQDDNPWDAFSTEETPPSAPTVDPVVIRAYGDEFEDAAINLKNLSDRSIEIRCAFAAPLLAGGAPKPEPDIAQRITLRRGVMVPAPNGGKVLDALPELGPGRLITLPPWETVQLWVVLDTHGLASETYPLSLYVGSLEQDAAVQTIPISLEVSPVRLPEGVYAQMNWVGVGIKETSDQQLRDMIDHGISVAYGPPMPALALNKDGQLAGEADWSTFNAALDRLPPYFQVLFPGPPGITWPADATPAADSPAAEQGYATAVKEMTRRLAEKGFGYDRWALYPYDEPWLTGFTIIPDLRRFCTRVKAIDPKVRIYADPTGLMRTEYVSEFKDLIDIWQPEINVLKRDPELRTWFQENAKSFWAYEATDPGKELLPLGYYRAYAWLAWMYGLQGAGFWCYKYNDAWWPLETVDWSVVYQDGDRVIPSRRWEACRDGQEDYRLLYALRTAIGAARAQGRTEAADRAQALMDEAVEKIIAWQPRTIDEITRQIRDYELDYTLLIDYRTRIGREILSLSEPAPTDEGTTKP